jgi:uncharacterized protein YndB with AHSA1/START domain
MSNQRPSFAKRDREMRLKDKAKAKAERRAAKRAAKAVATITREIFAAPERVFDAWLEPSLIAKWMTGVVDGDEVINVRTDARVGGTFSFLIKRSGEPIDHLGEYMEIDRPRRLVFTFDMHVAAQDPNPDGATLVTVDLEPTARGTRLTLTVDRLPREQVDRAETGWTKIIEAIERAVT